LIRHPKNEKLWRIYGRKDDQITHSTGEKVRSFFIVSFCLLIIYIDEPSSAWYEPPNPLIAYFLISPLLETILTKNVMIENAIMFGRGRFHAGVLINPADPYAFDPSDLDKLAEFRNGIWLVYFVLRTRFFLAN
jgi:hypothetical protein